MYLLDIELRAVTIISFIYRKVYWQSMEKYADREKPKMRTITKNERIEHIIYRLLWILPGLQLLGLQIFPFPHNIMIQIAGFILVITGLIIGISARKKLGTNWTHGAEHQIKKNQQLITTGIYYYIRHPIYFSIILSIAGAEIVAESYLSILFLFFLILSSYFQGRREEKILLEHFGNKYEIYKQKTKMLIPFII